MALHRYELSDLEWAVIHRLPNKPRGVPRSARTPVTTR